MVVVGVSSRTFAQSPDIDTPLLAAPERLREGALLVIVGDAIDFHQAWSFTRVLRSEEFASAAGGGGRQAFHSLNIGVEF